ncbi:radical SAM protein [Neptuniibacter sp. QD48_55]|uniref:radical SAM protein n=1 Tax=Neptuniibacter sp. QD48_55 TaxID=3398212 RepID=UPI0039F47B71
MLSIEERFDHSAYVSMTMEFRCNLKCVHCMIEGTMDYLEPQSREQFEELLAYNKAHKRWPGLILTGSEITLHRDLSELAKAAKQSGFQHVRIQSHGMHLGKLDYCAQLIDSGVDEFFISVAAADAQSHDAITQVQGSFNKTLQGMENIDRWEHTISITNTVVTKKSYKQLPQVVDALAHLKNLAQMEFWFYWPMSGKDEKTLLAPHLEMLPYLKEAVIKAQALGRRVEIKNFPQCLLGEFKHLLVNGQPQLFIDPVFWREFEKNGFYQCKHRESCQSTECLGLNSAYIKNFGWEEEILTPQANS